MRLNEKKGMLKFVITTCLIFSLCSCATTPIMPVVYDGQLPLYPAVVEALAQRNTKIQEVDIFKNEFRSGYIYAVDVLVSIRFKVSITKTNGSITSNLVKMQGLDSSTNQWSDVLPLIFDTNSYLNKITEDIAWILNNKQRYYSAKDKALSDLSFIHIIMKDLNDIGREKWINNNLKDRVFSFDLLLTEFRENNNSKIKKKFVAVFQYNNNNIGSFPEYYLYLYTNNEHYSSLKNGSNVSTKGSLVSVVKSKFSDSTFNLSLIEV